MYKKVFTIIRSKYEVAVTWKHLDPSSKLVGVIVDQDAANLLGKS